MQSEASEKTIFAWLIPASGSGYIEKPLQINLWDNAG